MRAGDRTRFGDMGGADGENYVDASSGGVDLFPGALAPTQQGWLEGNELFGLFWNLA